MSFPLPISSVAALAASCVRPSNDIRAFLAKPTDPGERAKRVVGHCRSLNPFLFICYPMVITIVYSNVEFLSASGYVPIPGMGWDVTEVRVPPGHIVRGNGSSTFGALIFQLVSPTGSSTPHLYYTAVGGTKLLQIPFHRGLSENRAESHVFQKLWLDHWALLDLQRCHGHDTR